MPAANVPETSATLLVSCDDCPGLVAALSQALYGQGANILHADQHLQRTGWHLIAPPRVWPFPPGELPS